MTERDQMGKPDPMKMAALRNLPADVMVKLTRGEVRAFLFDETWPDSLREKLKDYMVDDKQESPEEE